MTNHKKYGQNLIEFVFIMPILICITLAIFEVALFWQELNAIYSLNTEINANAALIDTKNLVMGTECPAVAVAKGVLERKDAIISMNDPTYNYAINLDGPSSPFSLYRIESNSQVHGKPQVTLWVDCRNPYENGITTQIEFYHKTMVMQASIPRYDSSDPADRIEIIPDNVFIASPKLNTVRHY